MQSDTSRDDFHSDSDNFDRLFDPTPTSPMPSGFELMHRTSTPESFTEFDLLSGTFDSSSGGNEQLDISDKDSVIVISSENEGERDFCDIRTRHSITEHDMPGFVISGTAGATVVKEYMSANMCTHKTVATLSQRCFEEAEGIMQKWEEGS
ncbi:hypothetical protein Bbelb_425390 [Branchiostoma belcheri]|nr:hypothetical protein Bbelb_425390 [Branchiostoma belcheri]